MSERMVQCPTGDHPGEMPMALIDDNTGQWMCAGGHAGRAITGYRYRGSQMEVLICTSVPQSDQEAIDYAATVDAFFKHHTPTIIERRRYDSAEYDMLPVMFDPVTRSFRPLELAE